MLRKLDPDQLSRSMFMLIASNDRDD